MASTSYSCRLEHTTDRQKYGFITGRSNVSHNRVSAGSSGFWGRFPLDASSHGSDLPYLESSRDARPFILPRVTLTSLRNHLSTCCQSNDIWHSTPPANGPHQPGGSTRFSHSVSSRSNADVFSPKGSDFRGNPPPKRRKAPQSAVLAPERSVTFQIPPPPLTLKERSLTVEATGDPEVYLALYNRLVKLKRYTLPPSHSPSHTLPSPLSSQPRTTLFGT